MKIAIDPKYKRLSNTKSGELVLGRMSGQSALMLVLEHQPMRIFLGVLHMSNPGRRLPFHIAPRPDGYCLSYGSDWVLEYATHPSLVNNERFAPGVISITEEGHRILMLAPFSDFEANELGYDLVSQSFVDPPSDCACVTSWRIWADASERLREGAMALHEFELPPDQAARS